MFAEAPRASEACLHVQNPLPPIILHGLPIEEVESLHDGAVAAAFVPVLGSKPSKIRTDQKTLHTVIASHPISMVASKNGGIERENAAAWKKRTIKWLRAQYGEELKCVLRHEDESHLHIHAYIIPSNPPEMRA